MIKLYTIGFTKKNAEYFFELLKKNNIKKLVDIRINNSSQLAGFAKGKDLDYFVKTICNATYEHNTDFAPTKELLSGYQAGTINWEEYQEIFNDLLLKRKIANKYDIQKYNNACFLCSEETADHCHRRLVVEYMQNFCPDVEIVHLK